MFKYSAKRKEEFRKLWIVRGGSESSTRLRIAHAQDNTRWWFKVRQFIKVLALICKSFKIIVLVFCLLFKFNMSKKIKIPANCEVRSVIRFHWDSPSNYSSVWRGCRMFNEGRENVHDEGRPLLATEELKEQITNVIGETSYWGTQYKWFLHFIITFKTATT